MLCQECWLWSWILWSWSVSRFGFCIKIHFHIYNWVIVEGDTSTTAESGGSTTTAASPTGSSGGCVGERGKDCIFPFTDNNGKTHDKCTREDPEDPNEPWNGEAWCKVGEEGTTLVYDFCDMTKCESKTSVSNHLIFTRIISKESVQQLKVWNASFLFLTKMESTQPALFMMTATENPGVEHPGLHWRNLMLNQETHQEEDRESLLNHLIQS